MEVLIIFGAFLGLSLLAYWFGADSRDGIESQEWKRRQRFIWHH